MNTPADLNFFYREHADEAARRNGGKFAAISCLAKSPSELFKIAARCPESIAYEHNALNRGRFYGEGEKTARSIAKNGDSFYGVTYDAALAMGSKGWKEGADRLAKESANYSAALTGTRVHVFHDVSGHTLNMGRVVENEPECFRRKRKVRGNAPKFVRIVAGIGVNGWMNADYIFKRGASIAVLIDKLEAANVRVELIGYDVSAIGTQPLQVVAACLKNYEDPVDLPLLAFCLCHPSFCRRLCWGVLDVIGATEAIGGPCNLRSVGDALLAKTADVAIDATNAGGLAWIQREAEKYGVQLYES